MVLPLIPIAIAAAAGGTGAVAGIRGLFQFMNANDKNKLAEEQHNNNVAALEESQTIISTNMDEVGTKELEVFASFTRFQDSFEKIHNRPELAEFYKDHAIDLVYLPEEIEKAAVGAGVLLGGLGGAALGTAGGFAAAGATTAAVMAWGTASTGTAIASLSGVAATNATLAALGGGAIAAGGGGVALGTAVLGAGTLGVGLMVGGIIFSIVGDKLSDKAEDALKQVEEETAQVEKILAFHRELNEYAVKFLEAFTSLSDIYYRELTILEYIVKKKQDYLEFSDQEKKVVENLILLVGLLFKMGQVKIVLHAETEDQANELGTVNKSSIDATVAEATLTIREID